MGELLIELGSLGIELALDGQDAGMLRYRPAELAPGVRQRIINHKTQLLDLLDCDLIPRAIMGQSEAEYTALERLGVADELAMRTHVGSPGWLVAFGEGIQAICQMAMPGVDSQCDNTAGNSVAGDHER